jgi:hypothetical protein
MRAVNSQDLDGPLLGNVAVRKVSINAGLLGQMGRREKERVQMKKMGYYEALLPPPGMFDQSMGMQQQYNAGMQQQFHPGSQQQYHQGMQQQFYPGSQQQYHQGTQQQLYPGSQQQFNPGMQQYNPGTQQQFHPGMPQQYHPVMQQQYNPYMQNQMMEQQAYTQQSSHPQMNGVEDLRDQYLSHERFVICILINR